MKNKIKLNIVFILGKQLIFNRSCLFLFGVMIVVVGLTSCDTATTGVDKPIPPNRTSVEQFFSFNIDSTGSLLELAIDTLRNRQTVYPFVKEFVKKHGVPVWRAQSTFLQQDQRVFLVPVQATTQQKVTGIIVVTITEHQPIFKWMPRGTKLKDPDLPDKKHLEGFMLMYEKIIYGEVQTADTNIDIKIHRRPGSGDNNVAGELLRMQRCYLWHNGIHLGVTCVTNYMWAGGGGGGGSSGSGGGCMFGCGSGGGLDVGCSQSGVAAPKRANPCGGGASGGDGGNSSGISFFGDIDTSDLANHPKAKCIYSTLSSTNTLKELISSFSGHDSNFDLIININSGNGVPNIGSKMSSDNFTINLFENNILNRNPLETAVTFMHEAIHAEMRRYLYGATTPSTLPGFPGDFASDWDNYVIEKFGDQDDPVDAAEHDAMAKKYISIIADAIQAFDSYHMDYSYYKALAWYGLIGTQAYQNLNQSKKDEIGRKYR